MTKLTHSTHIEIWIPGPKGEGERERGEEGGREGREGEGREGEGGGKGGGREGGEGGGREGGEGGRGGRGKGGLKQGFTCSSSYLCSCVFLFAFQVTYKQFQKLNCAGSVRHYTLNTCNQFHLECILLCLELSYETAV